MTILDGIRATGRQVLRTPDEFGNMITLTLIYQPAVQEWYLDIDFEGIAIRSHRLEPSFNALWPYTRKLGFGMGVTTTDGQRLFLINDFSSQRAQLIILTQAEVAMVDNFYIRTRA